VQALVEHCVAALQLALDVLAIEVACHLVAGPPLMEIQPVGCGNFHCVHRPMYLFWLGTSGGRVGLCGVKLHHVDGLLNCDPFLVSCPVDTTCPLTCEPHHLEELGVGSHQGGRWLAETGSG
jgi:hypothetical protein